MTVLCSIGTENFLEWIQVVKSKVWQLSKWRERREEFIKGKSCEWCDSEKNLAVHHPQKKNSLTDQEYESFDGAMILCKKCHFAFHRGYYLCPVCEKNYARVRYRQCSKCHKKEQGGKKRFFGEVDKLEYEFSTETDTYETRLEYCGNCKYHVEIDQELFCGLSPEILCDHGLYEENGVRRYQS